MRKFLPVSLTVISLLIVSISIIVLTKIPRDDRAWLDEYKRTATADIASSSVTIKNVRDWTYTDEILSQEWMDVSVDPTKVTSAWFIVEPFGAIEGIGHTFLSFEFTDGTVLSFSVQARQEVAEDYSAVKGALNTYELSYQWGTERDFIARRILFLHHDIQMYRLNISPEDAGRLFHAVLEETNTLAAQPRFYNTLTANCTNLLAKSVNEHYPNRLPYDISWNLTGYSDFYLMDQGLIENLSTHEATRAAADLTKHREAVRNIATSSPKEFSTKIRTLLSN